MLRPACARDRLAVALDVPDLAAARAAVARLGGVPGWLKIGSELYTAAGPAALGLAGESARIFLDTKLHDIPRTVAGSVAAAARHGVGMLTLHCAGGGAMLRAAREAAGEATAATGQERPLLVGVTLLTSLAPADLAEVGLAAPALDQVLRLAELALEAGLDGIVASPREAAALRGRFGSRPLVVTPGVRPVGWPRDDQARTATARQAIAAGADLLVVGRPVLGAADPGRAARDLIAEIEAGSTAPALDRPPDAP
jgi:orotidine-5'-phosphate decarboxylase